MEGLEPKSAICRLSLGPEIEFCGFSIVPTFNKNDVSIRRPSILSSNQRNQRIGAGVEGKRPCKCSRFYFEVSLNAKI